MSSKHEGGCLCGSVRYRVTGDPTWVGACHCKQCQRGTGTAFATVALFPDSQVEITCGVLKQYEYTSDESGRWLRIEFCNKCGTTVLAETENTPGEQGISCGTFDDPDWLDIKEHIWVRSAHHSVLIPPDAKICSGQPSH